MDLKFEYNLAKIDLSNVNFRAAYNFGIDLAVNKVKNARFSSIGLSGLLLKYPIIID